MVRLTNKFCGLLHVHSNYSFDGTLSLQDIRLICQSKKIDFIILAEHVDGIHFTPEKMSNLVGECNSLSNTDFLFIPGLEFNCEGMHILAIGIEEYFVEDQLELLISKIHEKGGIAVLAHASYYTQVPYEKLWELDGVEIWNVRYDGRFCPSIKSLRVLTNFNKHKELSAFAGLDLHEKHSVGKLSTRIQSTSLSKDELLSSLRQATFYSSNGFINLTPKNPRPKTELIAVLSIGLLYVFLKKTKRIISKILKRGLNCIRLYQK